MIIGIVGYASSGKSTTGDILKDYGFTKVAFADSLKDCVAQLFQWPRHLVEGDTEESRTFREKRDEYWSEKFGYDFTPRLALQKFGTESCRNVFSDKIWIYTVEKKILSHPNVVVCDTRFPNEIEHIRKLGGKIVRIARGPEPIWYNEALITNGLGNGTDTMPSYPRVHYSEWAWIGTKFDYTLDNNGSIDDLKKSVEHMMHLFKGE